MAELVEEYNEKNRKIIADAIADFLRTRMQYSKRLIEDGKYKHISFDLFLSICKYIKNRSNMERYASFEKDRILFTDKEIEELVLLVRESLTKYPIENMNCRKDHFSFIIRAVIENYIDNLREEEKKETDQAKKEEIEKKIERLMDWELLSYSEPMFSIDERIAGRIDWNKADGFAIIDSKYKTVIKIDADGNLCDIAKKDEEILIASDIYVGTAHIKEGNQVKRVYTALLAKDEEAKSVKTIIYDENVYPVSDQETGENYVEPTLIHFNDYLKMAGLEYFAQELYDDCEFHIIIKLITEWFKLTTEKLEEWEPAIEYAANWWAEVIASPSFDSKTLQPNKKKDESVEDEIKIDPVKIKKFKTNLTFEILGEMLTISPCFLLQNRNICRAASKAGLEDALDNLPWYVYMDIAPSEVTIRKGATPEKVIYSGSQDSESPKKI